MGIGPTPMQLQQEQLDDSLSNKQRSQNLEKYTGVTAKLRQRARDSQFSPEAE